MALSQTKTFTWPVHKSNGGGTAGVAALIEVGDTVHAVNQNRNLETFVVTAVSDGGKTLEWDITVGQPRAEDINGVDGRHQFVTADDDPLHTDETQFDDLPPVVQTS